MSSEPSPQPIPSATAPPRRRRRWLIPAAILLAVCAGAAFFLIRAGPERERSNALKSARGGAFAEAEPRLKAALQRAPGDAEVAEALARGYLKQEKAAEAEAALDRWIELRPDDRDALRFRFELHRNAKERAKAYPDGRRLLELDPSDDQLRRTLMGLAFSLARFEEAEVFCRGALQIQPEDRGLRSVLAEIRRDRGDLAEAGAILDGLIKETPNHTPALLARGVNHLDAGEPAKAIPLLREVVRLDPTRRRNATYKLAVALERNGEIEESRRAIDEVRRLTAVMNADDAVKTQPDNLALHVRQAEILLLEGHTKDGLQLLETVLARDPAFAPAHAALATHYERSGQPEKAAEHRKRAGL